MSMQGMDKAEVEWFQMHIRALLGQMFKEEPITTGSAYFIIWQQIRKILEDELSSVVNIGCQEELQKIKGN